MSTCRQVYKEQSLESFAYLTNLASTILSLNLIICNQFFSFAILQMEEWIGLLIWKQEAIFVGCTMSRERVIFVCFNISKVDYNIQQSMTGLRSNLGWTRIRRMVEHMFAPPPCTPSL